MTAFFLYYKRKIGWCIALLCLVFSLFSMQQAYTYTQVDTAVLGERFYFLVSNSAHVQASTQTVVLNGGAGYLLNNTQVAYSVYFSQDEVMRASAQVQELDEGVEQVSLLADHLYFRTSSQKRDKEQILSAFENLRGCMQVLQEEIARLDHGATQESSKRILKTLQKQFAYLKKIYAGKFPAFANVCNLANEQLDQIVAGIVYNRDLRYLLCDLTVSYVDLSQNFSL